MTHDRPKPGPAPGKPPRHAPGARPLAWEGLFQALGQGLGESYLGAFALWLQAGPFALGLVAALPTAGTALAQAAAGRLRGSARGARRFIGRVWSVQALAYASLGLCVFLRPEWAVPVLCALAFLAWGLGGIGVPAWTGLVSETVPPRSQGRFFGLRGTVQQLGVLVAILGGGWLLTMLTGQGLEAFGFVLLFALAGLSRLAGTTLLVRVPEQVRPPRRTRLADGLALFKESAKFRRLSLYLWGLHLGTYVGGPFFVPYMLHDLRLSYAVIGLLLAVPALVKFLTLRLWGRLADRVGPGRLLRTAGWLVVPVAALWLVSGDPWWIVGIQVYAGLVWGAFDLAQAAAMVQTTRGRESAVAFFNLVDGAMMIAGALLGGLLVGLFERFALPGYLGAIGCSSILRALPAAILLWRLRGIGRPGWSHLGMPLRVWAMRPTRGVLLRPWNGLTSRMNGAAQETPGGEDED